MKRRAAVSVRIGQGADMVRRACAGVRTILNALQSRKVSMFPLMRCGFGSGVGKRASSMRRQLVRAFLGLGLGLAFVFGLLGVIAYDVTVEYLVRSRLEPILELLIEMDGDRIRSAGEAGVSFAGRPAELLEVELLRDDAVAEDARPSRAGTDRLIRLESDRYLLTYRDHAGRVYGLRSEIDDFDDVEEGVTLAFLACLIGAPTLALVLGAVVSRRLVRPLPELTDLIRSGRSPETSPLHARQDETGCLARAFAERERELRAFLARERAFAGDVSHELRTPLTVMQGAVELLERRIPDEDRAARSVLERMGRTTASMIAVVNTLLLLARRPEHLETLETDLSALVAEEVAQVRDRLAGSPVEPVCEIAEAIRIRTNSDLARTVTANLLENACRYTEAGKIVVALNRGVLCVTDAAPPIPEELRSRMFERGERGRTGVPGTGLGLSLVQRACARLGWSVTHETPPQGGNRFVVRFGTASDAGPNAV